jgi:hypothetical protein
MATFERFLGAGAFSLACDRCGSGPFGTADVLKKNVVGSSYVCACGQQRPVEVAYLDALCDLPFANAFLLANWWQSGEVTVPFGLTAEVAFAPPVDVTHFVRAQAKANFPVHCAVIDVTPNGFRLVCGVLAKPVPTVPVTVSWMAAGYRGPDRPSFVEPMARAFHSLHEQPLREPRAVRMALLEGSTGFEMFVAWYLRKFVWSDPYFASSNTRTALVAGIVRDAGINGLTNVPLRVALRGLNLYRVFELLGVSTQGGVVTLDGLLADILAAISLRNKVVHEGVENPDERVVQRGLGAAYFLMEAVMLRLAEQHYSGHSEGFA